TVAAANRAGARPPRRRVPLRREERDLVHTRGRTGQRLGRWGATGNGAGAIAPLPSGLSARRVASFPPITLSPARTASPVSRSPAAAALLLLIAACAPQAGLATRDLPPFEPGEFWLDTEGNRIEAHAGGVLREGDTWYWYGE